MLIFNCTKSAVDFFTITKKGEKISPIKTAPSKLIADDQVSYSVQEANDNNPLVSQWVIHAIKANRKNCLVAMEYKTRFCFVLCDVKKGDDSGMINMFFEMLMNLIQHYGEAVGVFKKNDFNEHAAQFLKYHSKVEFYQRNDRSVQSHINEVVRCFKIRVSETHCLPNIDEAAHFSDSMNDFIRSVKPNKKSWFIPSEEMIVSYASNYLNYNEEQGKHLRESINTLSKSKHYESIQRYRAQKDIKIASNASDNVVCFNEFKNKRDKDNK